MKIIFFLTHYHNTFCLSQVLVLCPRFPHLPQTRRFFVGGDTGSLAGRRDGRTGLRVRDGLGQGPGPGKGHTKSLYQLSRIHGFSERDTTDDLWRDLWGGSQVEALQQ